MSDSPAARQSALRAVNDVNASPSLGGSLALVVAFWWGATGITLAMQRSELLSVLSIIASSALGVIGAWLIIRTRADASASGARLAFLGSSLLWMWSSTLFYAGLGIRIGSVAETGARTWLLAGQAIAATLRPDLVGVALFVAVAVFVRRSANRMALLTFAIYWCTLQTAKINVFMGVRNAGIDWLPEHLEPLSRFFGPAENSWLLSWTVLALSAFVLIVAHRARNARTVYERHAFGMAALLLTLALLEHVFLGMPFALPLWELFKGQP